MAAPTEVEKGLIKQFRDNVGDILVTEEQKSDPFLIRWLRARDHHLDKAEEMLRNSMKWREESNADLALSKIMDPWFAENFPFWVDTLGKHGQPVVEMPLGAWDVRRAMDGATKEADFVDYITVFFESITKAIKESNRDKKDGEFPTTQFLVIVDWKGYSYAQLIHWKALQNILRIAATYEAHYPEVLYRCLFINCPSIFPLFMALLKHVICPHTMKKITICGGEEEWRSVLDEEIEKEQLGTSYGGTKVRKVGDKVVTY